MRSPTDASADRISTGVSICAERSAFRTESPIERRKHPVEHDKVERSVGRPEQTVLTVTGLFDGMPLLQQAFGEVSSRFGIVFDQQDLRPMCTPARVAHLSITVRKTVRPRQGGTGESHNPDRTDAITSWVRLLGVRVSRPGLLDVLGRLGRGGRRRRDGGCGNDTQRDGGCDQSFHDFLSSVPLGSTSSRRRRYPTGHLKVISSGLRAVHGSLIRPLPCLVWVATVADQ